jgi:hypothetical protein
MGPIQAQLTDDTRAALKMCADCLASILRAEAGGTAGKAELTARRLVLHSVQAFENYLGETPPSRFWTRSLRKSRSTCCPCTRTWPANPARSPGPYRSGSSSPHTAGGYGTFCKTEAAGSLIRSRHSRKCPSHGPWPVHPSPCDAAPPQIKDLTVLYSIADDVDKRKESVTLPIPQHSAEDSRTHSGPKMRQRDRRGRL